MILVGGIITLRSRPMSESKQVPLFDVLNRAWNAGRDAAMASPDQTPEPPADFTEIELSEFREGVMIGQLDLKWLHQEGVEL